MLKNIIVLALLAYTLCIYGCATGPINIAIPSKPDVDPKKSSEFEQHLGAAGYYFMMLNFKFDDDMKLYNRVKKLGERLTYYSERPELKYKYIIIDSKYKNAFSIPDGYIFISNSLVNYFDEDEKLSAVLAHEIAHINHKHALLDYQRLKGAGPFSSILGRDVYKIANQAGYDMAYEIQADQTSMRYMRRAGYDPMVVADTLKELKAVEVEQEKVSEEDKKLLGPQPTPKFVFYSYHPYTENRIVNALNYLDEVNKTEEVKYNAKDFNF